MKPLISHNVKSLKGKSRVPGDKSLSHRALMLSSQVLGKTRINGLLEGEDVLATARALRQLGVTVQQLGPGRYEVQGVGIGGLKESQGVLDMGNAGTGARLLMGLLTPYPYHSFFAGDQSLCSRPMGRVMRPLEQMGASFTARNQDRLPLALIGTSSPKAIEYTLPVASAQVKSAILLAGLNTPGTTTVIEPEATRDHTENMLNYFGIKITREGNAIKLEGCQKIAPADRHLTIPADPSSAAFLIVAALITPESELLLENICINPLRIGLFDTLKEMGADLQYKNKGIVGGEHVADIEIKSCALKPVDVPATRAPSMIDEYPVLAIACAFAKGKSVLRGLNELRVKESDRLAAIVDGLTACGVKAWAEEDDLHIEGTGSMQGGATVVTHYDHRIAMSFLVAGCASKEAITVDDGKAIATSFPQFAELLNGLGARINEVQNNPTNRRLVIAIDGPAASGKGTLARRIAEYFDLGYLDTGSLYRAVGMKLAYSGQDASNKEAAIIAAQTIDENDLVNPRLRQEHIGRSASIVSAYPEVRGILLAFQRNFALNHPKGAVLDGRDIGTVVCPDADFKFFVTASLDARARRRHKELSGQGIEVVYNSVLDDLHERDERDAARTIAPLVAANDAHVIDTSVMDANSVFEKVKSLISND